MPSLTRDPDTSTAVSDGVSEAVEGPSERPPASSLDLCSESVDESATEIRVIGADEICPKRPQIVVCDQDPSLRQPASCDAYRCPACGPRKAMQSAAIAAWAVRRCDRARFVTLTLAPEDWQQRRQKMRDLRRLLAARGIRWEVAWATEKGSRTGMVHVHALQHGSYVPQDVLQDVWGAHVDIRAIPRADLAGGVARYVTKDALKVAGYTVKGSTASSAGHDQFLALNGGRAMHWSRGFLHGQTKREAASSMKSELSRGEPRTWHLEPWYAEGMAP